MQLVDVAHSLAQAAFPELDALRAEYGWSERNHRIFNRMFGLKSTALHPGVPLPEMLAISAACLAGRNPQLLGRVDSVFYCHAVNSAIPFDRDFLAHLVQEIFDCQPEVMSIAHASCASAIMVVRMLQQVESDRPRNIVILTGEKCYFEQLQYADNQGLYGEATTAAYLKLGSESGTRIVATAVGSFGELFTPIATTDKEAMLAFDQAFLPKMTRLVNDLLETAKMAPQDIDIIFPTHLSPFTSNRVANLVGMARAAIWKANLPHIGHCYCGDLFLNYQSWLDECSDGPSTNILSFASGMTGSYAGIVLKRN
jgi:3-oxoacyl-[acyl-carrier-protein] synthase III